MNRNIEVINENLWVVNMQYVRLGYIQDLKVNSDAPDQIYLSNEGRIILDSGSKVCPALVKLFVKCMDKSTEELEQMMKMQVRDSFEGLLQNVVGWEIKRRCVKADYMKSLPNPNILDKLFQIIHIK